MIFKQPRSVQVVIFSDAGSEREYLLLKRVESMGGFWQSVTGSLEAGETHLEAAVREVREETAIVANENELIDLALVNTFAIAPHWLVRYAPGVTHNEEVCFALEVEARVLEIALDPVEHVDFTWASYDSAIPMLRWESSRSAFQATHRLKVD